MCCICPAISVSVLAVLTTNNPDYRWVMICREPKSSLQLFCRQEMNLNVRQRIFWHVRPMRTQISLCIHAVWSESSLSAWRDFASLAIQNAPNEDSDQTARKRRLIWIFAWRTCPKVRFLKLRLKCVIYFRHWLPSNNDKLDICLAFL